MYALWMYMCVNAKYRCAGHSIAFSLLPVFCSPLFLPATNGRRCLCMSVKQVCIGICIWSRSCGTRTWVNERHGCHSSCTMAMETSMQRIAKKERGEQNRNFFFLRIKLCTTILYVFSLHCDAIAQWPVIISRRFKMKTKQLFIFLRHLLRERI